MRTPRELKKLSRRTGFMTEYKEWHMGEEKNIISLRLTPCFSLHPKATQPYHPTGRTREYPKENPEHNAGCPIHGHLGMESEGNRLNP